MFSCTLAYEFSWEVQVKIMIHYGKTQKLSLGMNHQDEGRKQ